MIFLGFDFGVSSFSFSKLDFYYKGSLFTSHPSANGVPFNFGFSGMYSFKQNPLFMGININVFSGNMNITWDYYGFSFQNSTNFNITQVKFLIGLYSIENFIFDIGFSPQVVSLKFNGDNGSSSGSSIGIGFQGDLLFPISKQFYIGFGGHFDYISSITTNYSENTNLSIIPRENKIFGLDFKVLGRVY
jgi:hypothetical protein